jgi:hypothetical protein
MAMAKEWAMARMAFFLPRRNAPVLGAVITLFLAHGTMSGFYQGGSQATIAFTGLAAFALAGAFVLAQSVRQSTSSGLGKWELRPQLSRPSPDQ